MHAVIIFRIVDMVCRCHNATNLALSSKQIHRWLIDKQRQIGNDPIMDRPKTYKATIEIYFDVWSIEKPRVIARRMAEHFNGTRCENLYCDGMLKKLEEWNIKKILKQFRGS